MTVLSGKMVLRKAPPGCVLHTLQSQSPSTPPPPPPPFRRPTPLLTIAWITSPYHHLDYLSTPSPESPLRTITCITSSLHHLDHLSVPSPGSPPHTIAWITCPRHHMDHLSISSPGSLLHAINWITSAAPSRSQSSGVALLHIRLHLHHSTTLTSNSPPPPNTRAAQNIFCPQAATF